MAAKTSKPSDKSKTVAPPGGPRRAGFGAANRSFGRRPWPSADTPDGRRHPSPMAIAGETASPRQSQLVDLAKEWMLDLRVLAPSGPCRALPYHFQLRLLAEGVASGSSPRACKAEPPWEGCIHGLNSKWRRNAVKRLTHCQLRRRSTCLDDAPPRHCTGRPPTRPCPRADRTFPDGDDARLCHALSPRSLLFPRQQSRLTVALQRRRDALTTPPAKLVVGASERDGDERFANDQGGLS
jgi:hypothetical protein